VNKRRGIDNTRTCGARSFETGSCCVVRQSDHSASVSNKTSRRHGLTLVEMMIALAITGLIGTAVASMLTAVAYGTSSSRDIRSLVVKNKTLSARVTAAIRGSAQLLDAADGYVVLWTKDLNGSGVPDLLELQRIELDSVADELTSYTPDPSATDVAYAITDDFDATTTALIGSGDMDGALWATGVTQLTITLDDADPLVAELVSFQLTLEAGGLADVSVNAVSLRD
jgi:prepilin-type N-terminal cleavage/methylation domain-containing protein